MSFQYWLGGSPENIESMLLMLANTYVEEVRSSVVLDGGSLGIGGSSGGDHTGRDRHQHHHLITN